MKDGTRIGIARFRVRERFTSEFPGCLRLSNRKPAQAASQALSLSFALVGSSLREEADNKLNQISSILFQFMRAVTGVLQPKASDNMCGQWKLSSARECLLVNITFTSRYDSFNYPWHKRKNKFTLASGCNSFQYHVFFIF